MLIKPSLSRFHVTCHFQPLIRPVLHILFITLLIINISGCTSEPTENSETPAQTSSPDKDMFPSEKQKPEDQINQNQPSDQKPEITSTDDESQLKKDRKVAEDMFEELFIERINGSNPEEYNQASDKFIELGAKTIIPQLIIELESEQLIRREIASTFLSRLALEAKEAEDILVNALEDESLFVRINAASTLSVLNSHIEKTVATLTELLPEKDEQISLIAIIALRNISGHSKSATPVLIKILPEADAKIKKEILKTLNAIQNLNEENLKVIQELANSETEDESIRDAAKKLIEATKVSTDKEEE